MLESFTKRDIHSILINGLNYAYLQEGNTGPAILFVHGFPDNALTWESAMTACSNAGYRCYAPFLRGYYPSDLHPEQNYSIDSIGEDLVAFMEAMGHSEFYLIGHDWGASIAYYICHALPPKIKALITVAIPHPRMIKPSFKSLIKANHFILYRFPKLGNWFTRRAKFAYLKSLFRKWAPNWAQPPAHFDMIKACFEMEGRTEAAIGYYQSFFKDLQNKALQKTIRKRGQHPTLTFAGKADGAIDFQQFIGMESVIENDFQLELHETAGHFLQQEDAEFFNQKVLEFLKKHP